METVVGVMPGSLLVAAAAGPERAKTIHVFVALCDNEHQGIVRVPEKLGNGADPANNLYWGALYGTKTFLRKSRDWTLVTTEKIVDRVARAYDQYQKCGLQAARRLFSSESPP